MRKRWPSCSLAKNYKAVLTSSRGHTHTHTLGRVLLRRRLLGAIGSYRVLVSETERFAE